MVTRSLLLLLPHPLCLLPHVHIVLPHVHIATCCIYLLIKYCQHHDQLPADGQTESP